MVKKVKSKSAAVKKKSSPKAPVAKAAARSAMSKYDQPGAPWWKKVALPMPK